MVVLFLALTAASPSMSATAFPTSSASQEEEAAKPEPEKTDSLGRNTPRGTFEGYIRAVAEEDYERAARYLHLTPLPFQDRLQRKELARILQQALDRNGNVPPALMLSKEPDGETDDDLPSGVERIGSLQIGDQEVPLLLQRHEVDDGQVWLISSETLRQLPRGMEDASTLAINKLIPAALVENKWYGVPLGHWVAMLLLALASYLVSRAVVAALGGLARILLGRRFGDYPAAMIKAFAVPLRLFMAVFVFVSVAQRAGVSIIARQNLSEAVVMLAWLSVLWLLWRLVDVVAAVGEKRMTSQARFGALSAVLLLRRSSRVLLVAIGVIVALATAGVDVTTGLAALGIGGIAFALGAQKMVENLVGSMTLVFDQPARIGDFCKVGETIGTIEQIGMRSTRIRTLERTLVTIPNGDIVAQIIENYSQRDRFLFEPTLRVRYQTSPDQLRFLLKELRTILDSHHRVDNDPARVRFLEFGSSSLDIEIFAYVFARDLDDYLEVQEDLNLRIADAVAASGTGFAIPSQTVYLAKESGSLATSEGLNRESTVETRGRAESKGPAEWNEQANEAAAANWAATRVS